MKKTVKILGVILLLIVAILVFDYVTWDGTCTGIYGDTYPCDWHPFGSLLIIGVLGYLLFPLSFAGLLWLLVTIIHYLTGKETKHPRDPS